MLSGSLPPAEAFAELKAFAARVEQRVEQYLSARPDKAEQADHLRHVADRTRWLYYSEMQRQSPSLSAHIPEHEDHLIDACVFCHDMGKWIPRPDLQALLTASASTLPAVFDKLRFTQPQRELFDLGVRRRMALAQDGYVTEYDSAHHLVSAYITITDPELAFHRLHAPDQQRLIEMIVGHQFGSYFKEQLFSLSMNDREVTTSILVEVARPERMLGDVLACAFHDADISDLLYVGSLERRPNREDILHTGGLIKILMINFINLVLDTPRAPRHLHECVRSCLFTVNTASEEFLTRTAMEYSPTWRKEGRRFLDVLGEKTIAERFNAVLLDKTRTVAERMQAVRMLTYLQARNFLKTPYDD